MCLLINGDCPAEQFIVDDQANRQDTQYDYKPALLDGSYWITEIEQCRDWVLGQM